MRLLARSALAFLQRRWASGNGISILKAQPELEQRLFRLTFSDGLESKYPFVWLRDNAPDPSTNELSDICRQRKMVLYDLDPKIVPKESSITDAGDLSVQWPDVPHPIKYSSQWLRDRDLQNRDLRRRRHEYYLDEQPHWGAKDLQEQLEQPADWERFYVDDEYLMHQMIRFLQYGIIRCANVPKKQGESVRFGKLMGFMQSSHYGDIWNVHSKAEVSNVAYTNQAIGIHTDLPILVNAPEVQILHMISQAPEGGANQFCDGLHVAAQIKKEHPEYYKMLCTVPLEYIDHGRDAYDYQLVSYRPLINLNKQGEPETIFYSNHYRTWFMDLEPEQVPKMYDAITTFNDYCYKPENQAKVKLNSGELVIFFNNRLMHGRDSYNVPATKQSTERHIEGGYVTFDMIKSKIRVLKSKFMPETMQVSK